MSMQRFVSALVMVAGFATLVAVPAQAEMEAATAAVPVACEVAEQPAQPALPEVAGSQELVQLALPNCGAYDGTACTTPGTNFRCQWIPTEPGLCRCSSSFVWVCG